MHKKKYAGSDGNRGARLEKRKRSGVFEERARNETER